jgi:hypothetical protein
MPMDNRLMIPRRNYDADALRYLNAVQLADGQALEPEVQAAVDAFVRGCKADGIFSAIKASCILCGARTISGALVPLVGAAPTNVADGFVSGDYTRGGATPGLQGDGTSYLDSGRNNNADPQNSQHVSVYASIQATSTPTTNPVYISANDVASDGATHIGRLSNNGALYIRSRQTGINFCLTGSGSETGLLGLSRNISSTYVVRRSGATVTPSVNGSRTSVTPFDGNVFVFGSTANYISNARLAFYSIGTAISDLALLDARVTALVTAIGAAV